MISMTELNIQDESICQSASKRKTLVTPFFLSRCLNPDPTLGPNFRSPLRWKPWKFLAVRILDKLCSGFSYFRVRASWLYQICRANFVYWINWYLLQTWTTKDCKGPQTNMPKNVGSIKTWSAKMKMMSCRVNFHVVRSALQYSACRI